MFMRRHVPNAVTISRGLCGPLIAWLLLQYDANFLSFWLFMAAIASDLLDGWLARLLDAHSAAGLWLDPLADKVLTDTVWAAMWWHGLCPHWLAAALIGRDIIVVLFWLFARSRGTKFPPSPIAQIGIAFEGVAVSVLLFHGPWLDIHWPSVGVVLGVITLLLSLFSMGQYAIQGPIARA